MRALAIGLLALNLCALALYAWDKHAARRGIRRVPEARLHLLALLGGWPGAWLGQRLFRHKTRKEPFSSRLLGIAVLQAVAISAVSAWVFFTP